MRIGIDLDNTLICYDGLFALVARDLGLIGDDTPPIKRAVRDQVRAGPDGETAWRRLQGRVYGRALGGASLFPGADAFLDAARRHGAAVVVVSHKTQYSDYDPDRVDLRQAARDWLAARRIETDGIYFEDTRDAKVARIAALDCAWFIDDLEDVLLHPRFPAGVRRLLFDPAGTADGGALHRVAHWDDAARAVFDD